MTGDAFTFVAPEEANGPARDRARDRQASAARHGAGFRLREGRPSDSRSRSPSGSPRSGPQGQRPRAVAREGPAARPEGRRWTRAPVGQAALAPSRSPSPLEAVPAGALSDEGRVHDRSHRRSDCHLRRARPGSLRRSSTRTRSTPSARRSFRPPSRRRFTRPASSACSFPSRWAAGTSPSPPRFASSKRSRGSTARPAGTCRSAPAAPSSATSSRARPSTRSSPTRARSSRARSTRRPPASSCPGGWRFSGKASYVSGSAQASWLMAAGLVLDDGSPQLVDGVPVLRAGLFPMRHCTILDTWAVSGMRGTGSNDCVFEDVARPGCLHVPSGPSRASAGSTGPFASIPLTVQLGVALSTVALGITRHAIDTLIEIAAAKVPVGSRSPLARAAARPDAARRGRRLAPRGARVPLRLE